MLRVRDSQMYEKNAISHLLFIRKPTDTWIVLGTIPNNLNCIFVWTDLSDHILLASICHAFMYFLEQFDSNGVKADSVYRLCIF